jgi:hypothetical protein
MLLHDDLPGQIAELIARYGSARERVAWVPDALERRKAYQEVLATWDEIGNLLDQLSPGAGEGIKRWPK